MLCENLFCIYYSDEECILDEIELDICGNCKCCIYVDIPEKQLAKKRHEGLYKGIIKP